MRFSPSYPNSIWTMLCDTPEVKSTFFSWRYETDANFNTWSSQTILLIMRFGVRMKIFWVENREMKKLTKCNSNKNYLRTLHAYCVPSVECICLKGKENIFWGEESSIDVGNNIEIKNYMLSEQVRHEKQSSDRDNEIWFNRVWMSKVKKELGQYDNSQFGLSRTDPRGRVSLKKQEQIHVCLESNE